MSGVTKAGCQAPCFCLSDHQLFKLAALNDVRAEDQRTPSIKSVNI